MQTMEIATELKKMKQKLLSKDKNYAQNHTLAKKSAFMIQDLGAIILSCYVICIIRSETKFTLCREICKENISEVISQCKCGRKYTAL